MIKPSTKEIGSELEQLVVAHLQEVDPTGEVDVCIATSEGNIDIHFAEQIEGYRDGPYQILERDESIDCYNVVGATYTNIGWKVLIRTCSIQNMLIDNPKLPVTIIGNDKTRMLKNVDMWKNEANNLNEKYDETLIRIEEKNRISQKDFE